MGHREIYEVFGFSRNAPNCATHCGPANDKEVLFGRCHDECSKRARWNHCKHIRSNHKGDISRSLTGSSSPLFRTISVEAL
jgi:hypothetical protein